MKTGVTTGLQKMEEKIIKTQEEIEGLMAAIQK